jgi:hypothetical protein
MNAKRIPLTETAKTLTEQYQKSESIREDKQFKGFLEAITTANPELSSRAKTTTLLMLDNLRTVLKEESSASSISNFINYGFDLIAAVMPNLVAHDLVSVQPMTRRVGEIFFQDFRYGTTKGNITANDVLFSPFVSGSGDIWYSHEIVYQEPHDTGDGSTTAFDFTLGMKPIVVSSITITDGVETFTADTTTPTILVGDKGGSGTINYTSGEVTLSFHTAPLIPTPTDPSVINATYKVNFEDNPDNIPEVDTSVYSYAIEAEKRALRVIYSLDSAYDLKMAFGKDMEAEMLTTLSNQIRANIDMEILNDLYLNSFSTIPTWDRDMPSGVPYLWHKEAFKDVVIAASNQIFTNTRRVQGNFMVCGINVCNVLESLDSFKKNAKKPLPGPYVLGTYNDMTVIKNPYYPTNEYVMGHKSDNWLDAGYVYAPYMALFATPPVTLDDLKTRRGMETRYAKRVINPRMYVKGAISGGIVPAPTT